MCSGICFCKIFTKEPKLAPELVLLGRSVRGHLTSARLEMCPEVFNGVRFQALIGKTTLWRNIVDKGSSQQEQGPLMDWLGGQLQARLL